MAGILAFKETIIALAITIIDSVVSQVQFWFRIKPFPLMRWMNSSWVPRILIIWQELVTEVKIEFLEKKIEPKKKNITTQTHEDKGNVIVKLPFKQNKTNLSSLGYHTSLRLNEILLSISVLLTWFSLHLFSTCTLSVFHLFSICTPEFALFISDPLFAIHPTNS